MRVRRGSSVVTRKALHPFLPHPRDAWRARAPRRSRVRVGGLWDRFADDRDLIGLKIALLVSLIILTAVLERAVY
jgi:hypothetical protein